jgi:hypothetical protein
MPVTNCPHPAARRTLHGDRALCAACLRNILPDPICHGCGATRAEIKARGGRDCLRERNGRPHCARCRADLDRR